MERVPDFARLARHRVRHSGDWASLEELSPGAYPRGFVTGDDVFLTDLEGHRVIDAGNHLGATLLGHGRAEMADAIADQVRTLEYSSLLAGASHPYVLRLADRLAALVPVEDPIFNFTSSGSEANEVAFKLARDYHRRLGRSNRVKILSRSGSYHGSTYGAMSATGLPGFREPFKPMVPGFELLPQPFPGYCGSCAWDVENGCPGACIDATAAIVESQGPDTIAAIIAEPVSIGGPAVKVPPAGYWPRLRALCDEHDILLIADEVITGFGRTGTMFGCEHWSVTPDLLTFAKGITSGYVPMGGVAVARRVEKVFDGTSFMNINTYAGHPVACAAAMKTLDIIEREGLVQRAASSGKVVREELTQIASRAAVPTRASTLGLLGSLEFFLPAEADADVLSALLWQACYERGVLLRTPASKNMVSLFFLPPLTIGDEVLHEALNSVRQAVLEVIGESGKVLASAIVS